MKKIVPLTFVLIGMALLITAILSWIDARNAAGPQDFSQSLRDWMTFIAGLGVCIKGWMDLAVKGTLPAPTQSNTDEAIISGTENSSNEVQRTNLAKSNFVGFIAHELKNPLTSIKGYVELLAAGSVGQVNELQVNFLNTIRANVERMSALVSNLNDDALIEAKNLRLDFKAVDLPNIVEEVVRSTRRQIEEKHQTLELHLPTERLPLALADHVRVSQILTHLISNANKYTPEGGQILLGAEVVPNQWDLNGARNVVHFWVKDNGIGISLEDQKHVFQKFFRSEDPKAREAPGTGLGLYLAKSLVEMMGGRIWYESEFRKGTTFHFTIPVAEE